jgi:hypothetical protein
MRAYLTLTCLACCLVFPAQAAEPGTPGTAPDHPAHLNELASKRAREGDLTTAWILLERAVLLAPDDERIMRKLRAVRAARAGKPADAGPAASAASPPAVSSPPAGDTDAQHRPVPALWPEK